MTAAAFPVTWLVVFVDVVRATAEANVEALPEATLIGMAVGSFLAPVAALTLWLFLNVMPGDMSPAALAVTIRARLAQRGEAGARTSAGIVVAVATSLLFLVVCYRLALLFMTRFHNTRLAALTLALVLLVVVSILMISTVRSREIFSRALARSALLSTPLVWVAMLPTLGLAAIGLLVARNEQTIEAIRFGPVAAPTIIGVSTYLLGYFILGRGRRISSIACGAVLVIGLVLAVAGSSAKSPKATLGSYALAEYSSFVRLPLRVLSSYLDGDGDGTPSAFGGGDCDDEDPSVSPWANEIANNGIDEDCSGADLILAPDAVLPWSVEPSESQPTDIAGIDPLLEHQRSWDVIVVTIDALRWDHVGYAGYERQGITPHLDWLAERSIRFDRAYSTSAKTPTAVPSILASRWPSEMYRSFDHFSRYDDENLFLAEVLSANGYLTAASTSHWYFRPRYGFADGFADWREYWVSGDRMERVPTSEQVADNAIDFLTAYYHDREETPEDMPPYFLWVHFVDPHKLYIDHDGFEPYGRSSMDRYDGEVRFADSHAGRIFQYLEAQDALEDTIIVLTSDHGEAFGEHDMRHHGWDLYEHQIRVPLMFYVPGAEPRAVSQAVSLIDLAPTIVDLMGDTIPDDFRGRSLLPAMARGEEPALVPIFAELPPGPFNTPKRSFSLGDWKLIHHPRGNHYRLFNLQTDPGELDDLWESEPEEARRLRNAYEVFLATQVESIRARGEED